MVANARDRIGGAMTDSPTHSTARSFGLSSVVDRFEGTVSDRYACRQSQGRWSRTIPQCPVSGVPRALAQATSRSCQPTCKALAVIESAIPI